MGEQHFCLRWNHHQSTLIRVFEALLHDESLVDVTLYAEGRHMRAHKVVLSACSGYFQTIFAAHTEAHPVIILKDVAFSELRALVDYMYRGEVSVSQDQLGSLIRTAESLQVKGLADGVGAGAKVHHNHQQQHQETTSVSPAAGPPPPLQPLPAAPPSPPAPPPQPLQLAPVRSTSPHAVTPLPAAAVPRYEHLNGTSSPVLQQPSAKRARWPSADAAATPTLSSILMPATSRTPPPSAVVPQVEQLPRIPATITPVPAAAPRRPDTPDTPELDLSVRSMAPLDVKQEQLASLMESRSDSGGELDAGSEGDAPPGPSTNFLQHAVGLHNSAAVDPSIMQHGFMKWPLSEGSVTGGGGGGDSPFGQQTDGTASQDVFLQRALNARFQQLLQQQRYDQLVAASSPVPPSTGPPPPPGCVGLPLLLRRESPTSPGKQYPCDKCGRHYASSGNLKRHIKYECGVEPQFQCPVCKKKFQHRHSVKIHVVSTHKTENPELIKDYLL